MKIKTLLMTVLFVFIGLSLIYLYIDSKNESVNPDLEQTESAIDNSSEQTIVSDVADSHSSQVHVIVKQKTGESSSIAEKGKSSDVDYVYYFMTAARCPSCVKIEAFTKEAVNENFMSELKKGTLKWEMIAVDKGGNEHFIKDYELYTKSVVLVKMRDGKQVSWKNLDQVWMLLGDKKAFKKYVTDEVTSFIGKG